MEKDRMVRKVIWITTISNCNKLGTTFIYKNIIWKYNKIYYAKKAVNMKKMDFKHINTLLNNINRHYMKKDMKMADELFDIMFKEFKLWKKEINTEISRKIDKEIKEDIEEITQYLHDTSSKLYHISRRFDLETLQKYELYEYRLILIDVEIELRGKYNIQHYYPHSKNENIYYDPDTNHVAQLSINKLKKANIPESIITKIKNKNKLNKEENKILHEKRLELVHSNVRASFVREYSGVLKSRMDNLELANKTNPKKIIKEFIKPRKEDIKKEIEFVMDAIKGRNHTNNGMALSGLIKRGKQINIEPELIKHILELLLKECSIYEKSRYKYKIVEY